MIYRNSDLKIFDCGAHLELTKAICKKLSLKPGKITLKRFNDGESFVRIDESIRDCDVFLIQPTVNPTNSNLMELLITIDAAKRASAARINVVLPYYGYCRQEKKNSGREAITAKLVANLITVAGADRVISIDLHTGAIQSFFDIPVDHFTAFYLFKDILEEKDIDKENMVIVSPDVGGATRARRLADLLKVQMAIIDKRRPKPNECEIMNIVGNVKDKVCVLTDDIADTARTLVKASNALINNGAKEVLALCTHPVLSKGSYELIDSSPIKEFIVTDTIPIPKEKLKKYKKIKVISVAELLSTCIRKIHDGSSITELF